MKYENIREGIFQARPNRFIAHVDIDGQTEVCHVKNTGRCRELLPVGTKVWLVESDNPKRKTRYDLVAVYKEAYEENGIQMPGQIVNMDSQAPNAAMLEFLQSDRFLSDITLLKPEKKFGDSRVDFYVETASGRRIFIEVKGVTLEHAGVASFPDAPTERGVKHLKELEKAVAEGYEAMVFFVIQMTNMQYMVPNGEHDPAFAAALRHAAEHGVQVVAYDCEVKPDGMTIQSPVEIDFFK